MINIYINIYSKTIAIYYVASRHNNMEVQSDLKYDNASQIKPIIRDACNQFFEQVMLAPIHDLESKVEYLGISNVDDNLAICDFTPENIQDLESILQFPNQIKGASLKIPINSQIATLIVENLFTISNLEYFGLEESIIHPDALKTLTRSCPANTLMYPGNLDEQNFIRMIENFASREQKGKILVDGENITQKKLTSLIDNISRFKAINLGMFNDPAQLSSILKALETSGIEELSLTKNLFEQEPEVAISLPEIFEIPSLKSLVFQDNTSDLIWFVEAMAENAKFRDLEKLAILENDKDPSLDIGIGSYICLNKEKIFSNFPKLKELKICAYDFHIPDEFDEALKLSLLNEIHQIKQLLKIK